MFVNVVIHVRFLFCRFLSGTLDPKIPTFCKFDYFSLLLVGNSFCVSNVLLYCRQYERAMSIDIPSMCNQVLLPHHDRNALRFLWDVNDSVVYHGMLVRSFCGVCCTYACTSLLFDCSKSTLHVVQNHDVSLNLSYINDCLLSIDSTEEMSNLVIQSESMLSNSCDFDPRKCLLYDPSMFRLIPDYNMSLDFESIVDSLSQLVSKALGISWAMPLKQWLSWLKYFGSWTNNPCPMLCCQFVFDNG